MSSCSNKRFWPRLLLSIFCTWAFNSLAAEFITPITCADSTSVTNSSEETASIPTDVITDINQNNFNKNSPDKNNIEKINILIHPVFDETNPDENNWLFNLVNKLHIDTHTYVIKDDLLFSESDALDEKLLAESERILRTRRYFNTALITSQVDCNHHSVVDVSVHEVWTLVPEITYSHTGGNSNYGFGLHDSNFLGTGKTVNLSHSSTVLRTGDLFEYYDPNTGFLDSIFSFQYANNNDGKSQAIALIKPFIALDTEWAGGISHENFTQEDTLYNAGKEVDRFSHRNSDQLFFYGLKLNTASRESVRRISVGYSYADDNFSSVGIPPDNSILVPEARQFSYPWVEYQHIYDGYIEAYNIQQLNRVEDINLGAQTRLRLGYTASKYDAYDKNFIYEAEYSQGLKISEQQLLLATATGTGLYDGDRIYNNIILGKVSYHWQNFRRAQFFVNLSASRGVHLFADLPLELGGDTGLRGYPIRYQAGDHLELLTIEQRYFGEREWFSLFHVGAAIFYDQGRVSGTSAIPQDQQGWLRDVGIGLRFSGTRTGNAEEGTHNVLHLDVAAPLDGSKDIAKVQWLVKVKKSF